MNTKLKAAIYAAGRRQKDVAAEAGISELELSKIITGRRKATEGEKGRIAGLLGVKSERVF